MDNNQLTRLLSNFRSYEYAARNCGPETHQLPTVIAERVQNPNTWDRHRYNRIVNLIRGAVDHVLSDDQRIVINRVYLERNKLTINQVSTILNIDRSTAYRWHKEALKLLSIALEPLTESEIEIQGFEHMFISGWRFKEPAS